MAFQGKNQVVDKMWSKEAAVYSEALGENTCLGCLFFDRNLSLRVFTQNLDNTLYLNILEWHLLQQAKVFHEESWYSETSGIGASGIGEIATIGESGQTLKI